VRGLGLTWRSPRGPRKLGGRYHTESLMKSGCAAKTIQTRLSHVSSFWNWMLARGVGEVNPRLRISSILPPSD
jgi:site-specific recombinase XerC